MTPADLAAIEARGVQSTDDALVMADAILDAPDGGVEWLMAHGCDVIDRLRAALRAERAQHAAAVAAAVAAERERCAAVCRDIASDAPGDASASEAADACAEAIDATAPAATTGGA